MLTRIKCHLLWNTFRRLADDDGDDDDDDDEEEEEGEEGED